MIFDFFFPKSFQPTLNESHDPWLILRNQHDSHPFQNHNNHRIHHFANSLHHLGDDRWGLTETFDIWTGCLHLQPRRCVFFFLFFFFFTLLILDYAYKFERTALSYINTRTTTMNEKGLETHLRLESLVFFFY
jgi:hypothetical protein